MGVKSDKWIRTMAREFGMITPFEEKQVRKGIIQLPFILTTFLSSKFLGSTTVELILVNTINSSLTLISYP